MPEYKVLEIMVPINCCVFDHNYFSYVRCPVCDKGFLPLTEGAFHLLANCKGSRHFVDEASLFKFLDGAPHR